MQHIKIKSIKINIQINLSLISLLRYLVQSYCVSDSMCEVSRTHDTEFWECGVWTPKWSL